MLYWVKQLDDEFREMTESLSDIRQPLIRAGNLILDPENAEKNLCLSSDPRRVALYPMGSGLTECL